MYFERLSFLQKSIENKETTTNIKEAKNEESVDFIKDQKKKENVNRKSIG